VAADPPDRLRLRAWKLTQAVLDLTLNEDGLFLYHKKQSDDSDAAVRKLSEDRFVAALTLLPGFGHTADWMPAGEANDGEFRITKAKADEHVLIECFVDKATLTRRRCVHRNDDGEVVQTLCFADYRSIHGTAWPMRLEVRGKYGHVDLTFESVDVNEGLSPRAFVPPRRAVKQP
jgi:hypothetical protein